MEGIVYVAGGDEEVIVLTNKKKTPFQIGESDYEAVSMYSWTIGMTGYPITSIGKYPNQTVLELHNFLLGRAVGEWDHINRDKLDNRRENLRDVSHSVNVRNSKIARNNTSGVRGVSWNSGKGLWQVYIRDKNKRHFCGLFKTIESAAVARRLAEDRIWNLER